MKALLRRIRQILKDRRTRRFLTRFVSGIAAVVVFVTTYALVLPAITMESEAACGIEAHQHDDSCYTENLICGQEESEGHHHTDDCFTVTMELECDLEEHQHSLENGCFDEEGNLVCKVEEHTHSDSCYQEHRELTCGLEETEGHHHTDSCYEKVLSCGKEVHTHSTSCYKADLKIESAAVASTGMTSAAAVPNLSDEDIYSEEPEHSPDDPAANEALDEQDQTDEDEEHTDKERADEDAENGDAYIPEKEELDFNTVLNSRTGIYYHHVAEDEEIEDSSAISDWDKADEDTELNRADLIRMYLSYTLPRDTVNATNDIARYRLPDSLHLTDEQVDAINECENGISSQYIEYDSLEITDVERHTAYLGLESVEGTRRPGEEPEEDDQEYISATVKAEKIYDEETGEYEGTDLIFTFSPYTVEKNAHAYDKKGQPTRAGEEVTGWLTLDFNMGQIDWAEDNTSEIIFAEEDRENKVSEISTVLKQADPSQAEDDDLAAAGMTEAAAEDMTADEDAADAATETAAADETAETAAQDATEEAAAADVTAEETAAADNTVDKAEEAGTEKTAAEAPDDEKDKKEESVAAGYPAAVFDDSITVRSGRLDSDLDDTDIPKKTKMTVHVEADEGTFPEGTRMVLSAVEDLDAVAEAVGTAIDAKTRGFQAVDITFYDKDPSEEDAKEIEPLKPIRVSIKSDEIKKAAEDSSTAPVVVHIEDNNTATEVESTASKTDSASIEIEKPGVEGEMTAPDNDSANNEDESKDAANKAGDNKNSENKAAEDKDREDAANEDAADESTEGVTGKNDAGEETDPAADDSTEGVTGTNDAGEETDSAADNSTEGMTGTNDAGEETDPAADDSSEGVTGTVDAAAGDAVSFEAGSFSIYAVVYTVDFHWEVNGKTYDFSLPGGGYVSFTALMEALGVADSESEDAVNDDDRYLSGSDQVLSINDLKISKATRDFVADVESVEFSNAELLSVRKVENDTTVGAIKDSLGSECQYSTVLTDEQIENINETKVQAGDWALISMLPFDTEESLVIAMKDGEIFTIRVTDAQIKKTVIDAKGETWEITVTYDENAKIPDDARLEVEEVLPRDDRYQKYYEKAIDTAYGRNTDKIAAEDEETKETKEIPAKAQGGLGKNAVTSKADTTKDDYARFFDISIWKDEEEIEPQAAVSVNIKLMDAPEKDTYCPAVVHFGNSGPEVMELKEQTAKGADEGLTFTTESFSIYGVIYTVDFHWELDGKKYAFSLKGGDSVGFNFLAEKLKLASHYRKVFGPAPEAQDDKDTTGDNETKSPEDDANTPGKTVADQTDAAETDSTEKENFIDITGIDQASVTISDDTREFLEQVNSVTFSTPEYMWVGKIEEDATTGSLMADNDLVPVYPNGTTDQDFCEIYMRKFAAPDWVLIALQPFQSEEALTVTMKNGDKFTIRVTDAGADAVLIPDGQGGQKVQTISNPSGTTIDLFDYYITSGTRNGQGKNGWPGHQGNDGINGWGFDYYDYDGNRKYDSYTNPAMSNDPDRNNDAYMNNGFLRGNGNNQGINNGHILKFYPGAAGSVEDYGDKDWNHIHGTSSAWTNNHDKYNSINSWTGSADPTTGLVENRLSGGYPTLTNDLSKGTGTIYNTNGSVRYNGGESLSYLFNHNNFTGKEYKGEVNQLLYVDSDGYYTYDSRYYSADLNNDNTFTVRKFSDSVATDSAQRGFWPFGDRVNWHGMHMKTNFSMPANGQVLNPNGVYKDMQFEFSGDDDTWLYIDGILVGDGGGIHNRTEIDINFKTGLVTVKGTEDPRHPGSYEWTRYLDEIYRDAGASTEDFDGHTFKSGTYHTFDMFYLERGGSESNLYIHYNLVSTSDFTAHKSYHTQSGDSRLERDQFQFELIGLDGRYEGEPGSRTLVDGDTSKAIMPKGGSASGAGTVASPKLEDTTTTLSTGTYSSQTFTIGVSEDGNVNFGDAEISQEQMHDCDEGHPATYRYIVREKVPGDAVNADGKTWAAASDEERAEGGFVKDGITYDGKTYYFEGTVRKQVQINPADGQTYEIYDIKKTRYTDDTYTTVDDDTKFFSFVNGYVEKLELKINKKGYSGEDTENTWPLSGAKFKLSRALYDETTQRWGPRPNGLSREATTGTEGYLAFPAMREGHYILEEEEVPDGYLPSGNKWLVTLTKVDTETRIILVPTITLLDEHGKVVMDGTTGQPIIQTYDVDDILLDQTSAANPSNPEKVEMAEYDILNKKEPKEVVVEKEWKKYNGEPYSAEELAALGSKVSGITVTGELWRHVTGQTAGQTPPPDPKVTIKAKLSNQSDSQYVTKFSETIAYDSDFSYSMAVRDTGVPQSQSTTPSDVTPKPAPDQNITYDNGINKPSGHVYTLENVTQDITVYAIFDSGKADNKGIGYYTVSKVDPSGQAAPEPTPVDRYEQVKAPGTENTTFTLNQANGWKLIWDDDDLDESNFTYTYELRNVLESDTNDFTFTQGPKTETEDPQTGKLIVHFPLSNQRNTEPVNIPVVKVWDPKPDDEANASVDVELHRYAKVTKGTFTVELKTEEGSPIQNATFTLYKDGEVFRENLTTDEKGQIVQTGLSAGNYYYKQVDTPFAYSMEGCTTQTEGWKVEGNVTTSQNHTEYLTNKAKKAVGTVTLTLVDQVYNTAINGAAFDLYKGNDLYRTNLVTAGEGQIEEGNLEAGTYHFVQTGYVSGYKQNVVTYDPPTFMVDASVVGTTQEISVTATNTKIAKGSAAVTLKRKDNNNPISGAKFELLQNGAVIREETTDTNGQVTFSNLGVGKYIIKQATTSEGLSLAENQSFEVVDNGHDDQGNSFDLTNDEKAGRITVELHRVQGNNTGHTYNTGGNKKVDEWTQLKPGTTIRVKIHRVQDGHDMFYCTDYEGNGLGTWSKITDWNGNDYYLSYTIPSSPEEATYKIGVSSAWGIDSGTVTFMNKPENGRGLNAISSAAGRFMSYMTKPVKALLGAGNGDDNNGQSNGTRTVPVVHADATPPAPPTDYVDDSNFKKTWTLRHTDDPNTDWKHVFENLEKYDPDGNEYVYYVVEKERTPDEYWVDKYEKDESTGTITITNKKETKGVVRVTKTFSGVSQLPDDFQITNSFNSEVFTVDGRNGTVAPSGTNPYTWTLNDVPAGTTVTFTETGIQVNGYNLTVNSSATAEDSAAVTSGSAIAGAEITAELINAYELKKTSVTLKKVDKDDVGEENPDLLKGATFVLSKYNSAEFREKDETWGTAGSKVLEDTKRPDGTYLLNGKFTFDDLTIGYYQLEETAFPDGYVQLTSNPTFKVEANGSNELFITIINNPDNLLRLVDGELTIVVGNTPGVELPHTGGSGTRFFTILGSVLILGAGVLLWRRRLV